MSKFRADFSKYSVALITMIILAMLLSFYFFFYVGNRDVQIRDRNFRVLNRIAFNINQRSSDYYKRIAPAADTSFKIIKEYHKKNRAVIDNRKLNTEIKNAVKIAKSAYVDSVPKSVIKPYNYSAYLWFPFKNPLLKDSASSYLDKYLVNLGVGADEFFSPLLQREEFSDFIVFHNSDVVYKTLSDGIDINQFDSLFSKNSVLKTSTIKSAEIAGRKYVLFSVQFRYREQDDWALTGLISESKLNKEKYSVPEGFLFFVLFCMLFVLVALPFIKAVLMNPNERMQLMDVSATFLSLIMGFALIVFVFFHLYNTNGPGKTDLDNRQKSLTDSIKKSFINDLTAAYRQLTAYDSLAEHFPYNSINLTKEKFLFINQENTYCPRGFSDSTISKPAYPYFSNVFWLDSLGYDSIQWTTDTVLSPKNYYSERDYFKNIKNGATWKLPYAGANGFYLQPVHSWTDGQFKAVISMSSRVILNQKKMLVAGLACRLPSVINPVLPLGYNFCIIDETGDVLFHSEVEKSTNENLPDECNKNSKLLSSMYSRTETFFNEYYSGKDCRMHISPIEGLPLYLVTIRDTGYYTSLNVQVFVFTAILFFSLIFFMLFHFFMISLLAKPHTLLKSKLLNMSWIWPDPECETIYLKTLILNLTMLFVSLLFCFMSNSFFNILCVFYNAFLTTSSLFIVYERKKNKKTSIKLLAYLTFVFLFITWFGIHIIDCTQLIFPVLYVITFILIALLIYKIDDEDIIWKPVKKKFSYEKTYSVMLISKLLISVFLPVFLFYRLSYNHETQNLIKYSQLSIVKKINQFTDLKSPDHYHYFIMNDSTGKGIQNIYTAPFATSVEIADTASQKIFDTDTSVCGSDDEFFVNLIQKVRIIYNSISRDEDQLININYRDTMGYHWMKVNDTTLAFKSTDYNQSDQNNGDLLYIKTHLPHFSAPSLFELPGFNFWLLFVIALAGLYYVIKYFITRLFLINYFSTHAAMPAEKFLPGYNDETRTFSGNIKIILTGLLYSGKKEYVMQLLYGGAKDKKDNTNISRDGKHIEIDLRNISNDTSWEKEKKKITDADKPEGTKTNKLIFISYFEYNISDAPSTAKKLEFIESLIKEGRNIIIISSIHPIIFLSAEKADSVPTVQAKIFSQYDYYKWTSLFSSFHLIHYPLNRDGLRFKEPIDQDIHTGNEPAEIDVENSGSTKDDSLDIIGKRIYISKFVEKECNHGSFLQEIGENLIQFISTSAIVPGTEEVILKIQQLSHSYYLAIWDSFTREEQYVLYDLAQDGLANYKNREALTLLFNNGIIVNHDRPHLMNRSFKNFILTEIKPGNVIMDEEERSKGSSWKKFKAPFLLVLISVLFFIFYTQEDTFNKMVAFIASFTAAIPLVLRIFTLLPSSKEDKSS